jgi:hypothetical protein
VRSVLAVSVLAVACSKEPVAEERPTPARALDCAPPAGAAAPQNGEALADVRSAAEGSPLYGALAARSTVASCRIISQSGSEVELEYTFVDGGALTFKRDPAIEYVNQEARFGSPSDDDGIELLRRVEQASFMPDGCGVDWKAAEPLASTAGVSENAFYGETCNCQARVRRDATGQLVQLVFRSAC